MTPLHPPAVIGDDTPSAEMEALRLRRLRAAFRDGPDARIVRRSPLARGLTAGVVLALLALLGAVIAGVVQSSIDANQKDKTPPSTVLSTTTSSAGVHSMSPSSSWSV
jgi:hypothetical protein